MRLSTIRYAIKNKKNIKLYFWIALGRFLPDRIYLEKVFYHKLGYHLNLDNPKSFNEKIQWLKLYNRNPLYPSLVDKYSVKQYVQDKIGEQYIIPTLGVWNDAYEIDFDKLPDQFVLKTTHAGGGLGVIICKDKASFDRQNAIIQLNKCLKRNHAKLGREWVYDKVPRRIIAEKYISEQGYGGNSDDKDIPDYKFYCFDGEPKYCQVIRDRRSHETIDFYDMEWNHQEFCGLNLVARNGQTPVARPNKLDQMINVCRILSKGIPFIRVDLYVVRDEIYFGELTFFPASGFGIFTPAKWNNLLGDMINIQGEKGRMYI